ncbi:hypothetical protein [Thermithiobacillus plumbiphilus]|uniref:Uncharacterized protein n=1 Tax=Thermithiobacillus plumbiphilus TaxID=1729899 RepID=A0ABU9DDE1_9PROT
MTLEKQSLTPDLDNDAAVRQTLEHYLRAFDEAWRRCGESGSHGSLISRAQMAHHLALEMVSRESRPLGGADDAPDDNTPF